MDAVATGWPRPRPRTRSFKILDTTRECVLVVDRDMRIVNCNVPAAVAFGREGSISSTATERESFAISICTRLSQSRGRSSFGDVRLELNRAKPRI